MLHALEPFAFLDSEKHLRILLISSLHHAPKLPLSQLVNLYEQFLKPPRPLFR